MSSALPKIMFSTRFSFYGNSGWKSDYSADPAMLFDEDRLVQRFWLYENITLPSLAAQADEDFHVFVLSSNLMPAWAQARLNELCTKYLGPERFTTRFARFAPARKYQRFKLAAHDEGRAIAQVVLDDDDAIATDFVSTLRAHLADRGPVGEDSSPFFFTFPVGYALGLREEEAKIWRHGYKFINLGLTMVASSEQKNIFGINHRNAPKHFGFTADYERPMYIRTLSNINDSRVAVRDKWQPIDHWRAEQDIKDRFPFLLDADFSAYQALPMPGGVERPEH